MLTMIAMAEEDGWAFVRIDNELFSVRPPYQHWNKTIATERMVEQGITHHGFVHTEKDFQDWNELIHHLKQVQVAAGEKRKGGPFSGQKIENLVHHMSANRLAEFLNRVEEDLFPYKKWLEAQNLLTTLLGVKTLRQDDELNSRAVSLLKQCQNEVNTPSPKGEGFD